MGRVRMVRRSFGFWRSTRSIAVISKYSARAACQLSLPRTGQWSLSTAFLASIAFFLALKMVFYSSAFVPPGVMNRYNPLPSKSFCTFSAGFAARMRVGQGHGVILLTLLPSIREQVEPDSIAHYGYMFSLQRLEYQRIPSSPQQAFPEICSII